MDNFEVNIHECDFSDAEDLKAVDTLMNAYIEDKFGGGELIDKVEFWTMVKHLMLTDRFGEFAPRICMEAVPMLAKKKY